MGIFKQIVNKITKITIYALFTFVILISSCNFWVIYSSRKLIYNEINQVPKFQVGLVLGTSKYFSDGSPNLFFKYRIEAAYQLYVNNKIKYIIVSGDNKELNYNEPQQMKRELIKMGVPDSVIIFDFAGFRTLDSVLRCKEIFDQQSFVIISQEFQNQRAVYIARHYNIDAVAFNAQSVDVNFGIKTYLREIFAKVKVMIDVHLTHQRPKFLGRKISLPATDQ